MTESKSKKEIKVFSKKGDAIDEDFDKIDIVEPEVLPEKNEFNNSQLALFQSFFPTEKNDNNKSTTFEFFDTSPRFSISKVAMNKMREGNNGILPILELPFTFEKQEYVVKIHPAAVPVKDPKTGKTESKYFYPSANEELVEEVLRKFAGIQNSGFHAVKKRSGVVFSLNQVREELRRRGHARTCADIVLSLNILSLSFIEYNAIAKKNPKAFNRSPYIPVIGSVSRDNYNTDPTARWYIEFHRLITEGIDSVEYRQLAYDALMSYRTQLGRWVHKWLTNKFTYANMLNSFDLYFSVIKVHSRLLDNYALERQKIKACDDVMDELIKLNVAKEVTKEITKGKNNKIEQVLYKIKPTSRFVKEAKAANARKRDHLKLINSK